MQPLVAAATLTLLQISVLMLVIAAAVPPLTATDGSHLKHHEQFGLFSSVPMSSRDFEGDDESTLPLPPGTLASGSCPDGPPVQWQAQLDAASKAILAPIVFNGKLISLSEDYGGRVAATFRVLKQVKNIGSKHGTVPVNLLIGTQVTLYFVTGPRAGAAGVPPYCAARLNSTQFEALRPEGKYIVFAASPLTALIELHRLQLKRQLGGGGGGGPSRDSALSALSTTPGDGPMSSSSLATTTTTTTTTTGSVMAWPLPSSTLGSQLQQLQQLYANFLSAFAAPEPLSKRSSRALRKALCTRCAKAPQVRGPAGDLRVDSRSRLRLRCRVAGNPFPWVEWFRNGKKLKSNRRVSIRTRRRVSRLEIKRVTPSMDTGYYECRAMNAVAREPAVARTRVIVISGRVWPTRTPTSTRTPSSSGSQSRHRLPTLPTTAPNIFSPWYEHPCPKPNYCLNGGSCTYIKPLAEYYCKCAEGYKGQRCQNKDIYVSLVTSDQSHQNSNGGGQLSEEQLQL